MNIISEKIKVTNAVNSSFEITPSATPNSSKVINVDDILTSVTLANKADLVGGKVPVSQLPGYVDDILVGMFVNATTFKDLGGVVFTPEVNKIYLDNPSNQAYRWTGVSYVAIPGGIALGETSGSAYRGDRGKTAFDHSQSTGNPHNTTATDVGLGSVNNTSDLDKPVSTATQQALNTKVDRVVQYEVKTASFTLDASNAGKIIELNSASAIQITVPKDVFTTDVRIEFVRMGTGDVVFVADNVIIRSADSSLTLRAQYSSAALTRRESNDFVLVGDLLQPENI